MPDIEDQLLDEVPDHAGPEYQQQRATLTAAGMSEEAATQFLRDTWETDNQRRLQQRAAREAEEQRAREEAARQEREAEDRRAAETAAMEETERREAEKKNVKAGDFSEGKMVASFNEPKPSLFAMDKLTKKEYIELWYFTREGCREAEIDKFTAPKDALGLEGREGEPVQFRSIASTRASKNARPDNKLTWAQVSQASKILLRCMEATGWSPKHIRALTDFFIELDCFLAIQPAEFDRAIVEYQHLVRFEWHSTLGTFSSFDISCINPERINAIHQSLNAKEHRQMMASYFPFLARNPDN